MPLVEFTYQDYLKYILIDTNGFSKEQLLNSESMVGYAMIADISNTNEEVAEAIETMLIRKPNKREETLGLIDYVFEGRLKDKESLKEKIRRNTILNKTFILKFLT